MSKITNPDGGGEIHPIKKGEKRGRKPGVPNKITTLIKDAAMAAIEEAAQCRGRRFGRKWRLGTLRG
jgi:hypothetical protein